MDTLIEDILAGRNTQHDAAVEAIEHLQARVAELEVIKKAAEGVVRPREYWVAIGADFYEIEKSERRARDYQDALEVIKVREVTTE